MSTVLLVEIRRYLARRLTRVLIGLALLVILIVGIAVYFANEPLAAGAFAEADDPRLLTAQWIEGAEGSSLMLNVAFFLTVTALIAGASMVGAEWKAGTVTQLLTWEPRRTRVAVAKFAAAGLLAFLISAVLILLFTAAFLPTVFSKGTSEGADASWFTAYLTGVGRLSAASATAAVVGAAIAMIGRNTNAAVGFAFGYFLVFENLVRGLRPRYQRWLVSENMVSWITNGEGTESFIRSGNKAGLTLLAYALIISAAAWAVFSRRDVAGAG